MDLDNVPTEKKDMALRFLLHRIKGDMRFQMMAELPTVYRALFPTVSADTILSHVQEQL